MFWGSFRRRPSVSTTTSAGAAKLKAEQVGMYLEQTEQKLDALALACQAMWELLRDNTRLGQDDLIAKMEEIDIRDGQRDGRITPVAELCSKCGRKITRKRSSCMYCGATVDSDDVFGTLS